MLNPSSPHTFELTQSERNLLRTQTSNSNKLTVRFTADTYIPGASAPSDWSYGCNTMSIVNAKASLYGENKLMEYSSSFQNATVSLTTADDSYTVFTDLLGRKKEGTTNRYRSNINDKIPYVGFVYIVSKMTDGKNLYRV